MVELDSDSVLRVTNADGNEASEHLCLHDFRMYEYNPASPRMALDDMAA